MKAPAGGAPSNSIATRVVRHIYCTAVTATWSVTIVVDRFRSQLSMHRALPRSPYTHSGSKSGFRLLSKACGGSTKA